MIPIIITVRKQSGRCQNKILRKFYGSDSLLDICLRKFIGNKSVYVAGYEQEFKEMATKYGVNFIQRTEKSALSEDALVIHSHLKGKFDTVCQLNPCCPCVKASTVYDAIDTFTKLGVKSLFSVKESHELIFNFKKELINIDRVFNSKIRRTNYIGNNALLIYKPDIFFSTGSYWTYKENDPYLYIMTDVESLDIDTELDFNIAQTMFL